MRTSKLLPLFLLSFLVFGCTADGLCIIPREPELRNKQFPIASTESYYYIDVDAGIRNEPRDNDYDYYFEVIGIPAGMDYFINYRTVSIEGTPIEAGTYEITVFVEVDGPFRNNFNEQPDRLCNYSTSKTYTLIVE
jgi:hypothetical protein